MLCIKKLSGSESGNGGGAEGESEVNIDLILAAGITRGLRMQDTEYMTIGMWVDYIIEWNELHQCNSPTDKNGNKIEVRRATQSDFDKF